jgi:hypothetical protein
MKHPRRDALDSRAVADAATSPVKPDTVRIKELAAELEQEPHLDPPK